MKRLCLSHLSAAQYSDDIVVSTDAVVVVSDGHVAAEVVVSAGHVIVVFSTWQHISPQRKNKNVDDAIRISFKMSRKQMSLFWFRTRKSNRKRHTNSRLQMLNSHNQLSTNIYSSMMGSPSLRSNRATLKLNHRTS